MRIGLLAIATLFLGSSTVLADDPPLPPIVFQTQPLGRVLDDVRTAADLVGGDKGVKALNKGIKELLGEKGFEGLDVGRPIVGYVILAAKPEDITAVIALPITNEKDFLALCDRLNKEKPKADDKDKALYHLPAIDPQYQALMRFSNQYAYIAYGANPGPHIDAKALVPMPKLYDPNEKGLIAARLHFDRIPLAVKLALPKLWEEMKKKLMEGGLAGGNDQQDVFKAAMGEYEKLLVRYVKLAAGADAIAARVFIDAPSGNVVFEGTINGKPDSDLAKQIAAFKPTGNRFGKLLDHPDTVAGFKFRSPLFEEELRTATVLGLDAGQKKVDENVPEFAKATLEELFKGLGRTVKTGELDVVAGVRGPDKKGWFTAVGAIAFEDPSKLEKELKALIEKQAPQQIQDGIKWNAAKVGNINIHTWKVPGGDFVDPTKVFGGDDCTVAFAFAPHGVFAAIGPDPVDTLKDALAVKPAASPILDVLVNPARTTKLVRKIVGDGDPSAEIAERILGMDDKLVSALSVKLEGGKEMKLTVAMNLKMIPRAILFFNGAPDNKDE